jgi:mycothiol synthase
VKGAEIAELVRAAAEADGFSALNEAAHLHLRHPHPGIEHVVVERDGQVVGYGQLDSADPPTGALVVHPNYRRRGVGTEVLRRLLALSGGSLQIWAVTNTPAAAALAARAGLTPSRTLLVMSRPLSDPLPAVEVPEGTVIRGFVPGQDEEDWLRLNARAFASHPEQGSLTATDLAERMGEPWFDPAGLLLAEQDGRLAGFHWTKRHGPLRGEVYVLGVDPDASGGGLGRALLGTGLEYLRREGCTEVILYVDADYERAVRLYQKSGFTVISADVLYRSTPG